MQKFEIKAVKRENTGKTVTRKLRESQQIPCVIYGGEKVVHFYSSESEFRHLVYTPHVYQVVIHVDGASYDAILQDLQFHPVSDKILHVDFLQIDEKKPITIDLPVRLEGLAEGVKAGGKLQLEQRKIRVKGLAKNIPNELVINITNLGVGKSIQVGDLSYPNLELPGAKNSVVVSLKLTRAARAATQPKG